MRSSNCTGVCSSPLEGPLVFATSGSSNRPWRNPPQRFDGADLHPTLVDKAAALGFSLLANHPFVDGNKRIGHAAMEVFLVLNGCEIQASVDDQEHLMLAVASGALDRQQLASWLNQHVGKPPLLSRSKWDTRFSRSSALKKPSR